MSDSVRVAGSQSSFWRAFVYRFNLDTMLKAVAAALFVALFAPNNKVRYKIKKDFAIATANWTFLFKKSIKAKNIII